MSGLVRGTADFADCGDCPFSRYGKPNLPVFSEGPEDPLFIIVGEGPGRNETLLRRPFVGASGEVVNKMLAWAGVPRRRVLLTNATLCQPPPGAADEDKTKAARHCSLRLQNELQQHPGKPILALGGVAAKSIIPTAVLEAIDPPDKLPSHKRKQKSKAKEQKEQEREQRILRKRRLSALRARYERDHPVPKEERKRDKRKQEVASATALQLGLLETNAGLGDGAAIEALAALDEEGETIAMIDVLVKRSRTTKSPFYKGKRKDKKTGVEHDHWDLAGARRFMADEVVRLRRAGGTELALLREAASPRAKPEPKADQVAPPKAAGKKRGVGISDIASTHFHVSVDGGPPRSVIPCIHPAAILRGGGKAIAGTHTPDLAFWNLVADTAKVSALAQGKDVTLQFVGDTEVADPERAARLMRDFYEHAMERGAFALDLETYVEDEDRHHALMAYKAKIRAIGLATPEYGISVLWDLLPQWSRNLLRILLLKESLTCVMHNSLYDATVLEANGFPMTCRRDDSLLGHHAAFPGAAHNLQSVTAQFKAVEAWKSEFRNNEETPEALTRYNLKDTISTASIIAPVTMWIQRTKTEKVYAIDRKMAECASQMHLNGVPMSREVNAQLFEQFTQVVKKSRETVERLLDDAETRRVVWHHLAFEQAKKQRKADPESFQDRHSLRLGEIATKFAKGKWKWKISANQHVAALLRALGVQLLQLTDTGATKVNKEILENLIEVPIVRDVLRFRENDKRLMTFVWPIFDRQLPNGGVSYGFADEWDRVHPIWSIHKITGRWASSDPVCSNVPKEKIKKHPDGTIEVLVPNLRAQVVAPRGRIFVGFDFRQLEAKLIALLSGDEWLCSIFRDGKDIHKEAARIIFPGFDDKDPKIQKQLRDLAKPFEYGAFYGAEPETLYKALVKAGHNMRREDVYKAYYTLMARMPGVVRFQNDTIAKASQPPFEIVSFLCERRRCFPLGEVDPNEARNFGIQCAGADIMNTGMANMMSYLLKYKQAYSILQIHDAAVFECWEDDAEPLLRDVHQAFEQEFTVNGQTMLFSIDGKIAKTWAEV